MTQCCELCLLNKPVNYWPRRSQTATVTGTAGPRHQSRQILVQLASMKGKRTARQIDQVTALIPQQADRKELSHSCAGAQNPYMHPAGDPSRCRPNMQREGAMLALMQLLCSRRGGVGAFVCWLPRRNTRACRARYQGPWPCRRPRIVRLVRQRRQRRAPEVESCVLRQLRVLRLHRRGCRKPCDHITRGASKSQHNNQQHWGTQHPWMTLKTS